MEKPWITKYFYLLVIAINSERGLGKDDRVITIKIKIFPNKVDGSMVFKFNNLFQINIATV